jgi:hypothetical protein
LGPTARNPEPQRQERFRAKWIPVRVKKTRQNKNLEPRSDSIGTEKAREALTMARLRSLLRYCAPMAALILVASPHARAEDFNDYPTSARADYVFGCMKANGETQELLQKCSCSIDVIASIIPYDHYVTAETIISMSQVTGPVGSEFRSTEQAKVALQEFRRAQAEAEIRCF